MSQKKKILIIDDEVDLTLLVKLNLQKTGLYEVRAENRAINGLAAAREFKPDLVLLDVMMPDLDGGDVLAQLKGDPKLKDVPVVFLTATVLKEEVAKKGGSIGGYPYIPKPFRVEVLLNQIASMLPPPEAPTEAPKSPETRVAFDPRVPRNPMARRREDRNPSRQ
jgi:DNA-binding response OmpR family regulator